jgi:small subunit ribosomal protein S16
MLSIRLKRIGKKHQPSYRIVVAERRSKRDGSPVEDLGYYHPFSKAFSANGDRVKYWLSKGAHATPTVHNLLIANQLIEGSKVSLRISPPQKERVESASASEVPAQGAA